MVTYVQDKRINKKTGSDFYEHYNNYRELDKKLGNKKE